MNESNVKEINSCHKPHHYDKMKWNFKLVRPEHIVDGLKHTGPADKKESGNEGKKKVSLLENGLTLSRMEMKESALAPKRKLSMESAVFPKRKLSLEYAQVKQGKFNHFNGDLENIIPFWTPPF